MVRLTIEGPWGNKHGAGWVIPEGEVSGFARPDSISIRPEDVLRIEKIEPPVEQFKAGDVVRPLPWTGESDKVYFLTTTGFVRVSGRRGYTLAKTFEHYEFSLAEFTSVKYERVDVQLV